MVFQNSLRFVNKKSPAFTYLDFDIPWFYFPFVEYIVFYTPFSVSPIFIQLIPFSAFVKYASVGLGEPPLAISHMFGEFCPSPRIWDFKWQSHHLCKLFPPSICS